MHISDEGLVSGSVDRAELVAAYAAATGKAVKANLAACGAENGMYVEGDRLVDPSEPELEPAADVEPEPAADVDDLDGLRAQAEALGIKVDRRWGADRLRDEIAGTEPDDSEE
jgi:hypothetical protein